MESCVIARTLSNDEVLRLDRLPEEILQHIAGYTEHWDLTALTSINRRLHSMCVSRYVFESIIDRTCDGLGLWWRTQVIREGEPSLASLSRLALACSCAQENLCSDFGKYASGRSFRWAPHLASLRRTFSRNGISLLDSTDTS